MKRSLIFHKTIILPVSETHVHLVAKDTFPFPYPIDPSTAVFVAVNLEHSESFLFAFLILSFVGIAILPDKLTIAVILAILERTSISVTVRVFNCAISFELTLLELTFVEPSFLEGQFSLPVIKIIVEFA